MVQDVEVGRALREAALVADATGAASVSAHAGNDQPRDEPTHNGDLYAAAKAYVDAYDAAVVCWVLAPDFYDKLETVFCPGPQSRLC